jgi:hypothetical protein
MPLIRTVCNLLIDIGLNRRTSRLHPILQSNPWRIGNGLRLLIGLGYTLKKAHQGLIPSSNLISFLMMHGNDLRLHTVPG